MDTLDLAVLGAYVGGTVWLGLALSRGQSTVRDYFTSGRRAPWWVVMASIVATETSTVTVVSVPGFAFGTDLTFLQLVLGYLVGRVVVTLVFLPGYFRGDYLTAYQVLAERFGGGVGRLAATIFLATRNLADGFRLFATGLVLGAVLLTLPGARATATALAPSLDPTTTVLVVSVLVLGLITIAYTYLGGMTAVLWTDLVQLAVYVGGSAVAAVLLLDLFTRRNAPRPPLPTKRRGIEPLRSRHPRRCRSPRRLAQPRAGIHAGGLRVDPRRRHRLHRRRTKHAASPSPNASGKAPASAHLPKLLRQI